MNYLNGKAVYLCGAMSAYKDSGMAWREWIKPILVDRFELKVHDPTRKQVAAAIEIGENKEHFRELIMDEKWQELKDAFALVCRYDLRAVDLSDFLIVDYDSACHTVGTIHELVVASSQKKPILVKYKKEQLNTFNPWMSVLICPEHFFSEWDDLFAYLDRVNKGEVNSDYWSIV
jgi:hypothetical protein